MCGILALFDFSCHETEALRALNTLSHRGPDACGTWAGENVWLGARRLAVTDVSSRGDQPFVDECSGAVLVFNGEIYNFRDIRRELTSHRHSFLTDCDTEVVLHAYLQWGAACVKRFNGMWAFALFDPRAETLFCSRDRLGVKPLYWARLAGGVALASEPKALVALDASLSAPDYEALSRLLVAKRLHGDERSFHAQIHAVPPACHGVMRRRARRPSMSRYWHAGERLESPGRTADDDDRQLGRLLERAVRVRLDCEQGVGLALSGGLDSTAILVASGRSPGLRLLRAYTSVYAVPTVRDDRPWARRAAQSSALELTEVLAPAEEWLETLRKIVRHMDGPGYTPAVYPLWKLMQTARADGIKVMLDGQGADELLAGYPRHVSAAVIDAARECWPSGARRRPAAVLGLTRAGAATYGWARLAQDVLLETSARARELHRWSTTVLPALERDFAAPALELQAQAVESRLLRAKLLGDLTSDVLPGFLHYGDAISMAHGVEARQPFLDIDVVEHCLCLDTAKKVTALGTKAPLRSYLMRCGQAELAQRSRKQGYPTPVGAWMRDRDGAILREILLDPAACISSFTLARDLERLITRFTRGHAALGECLYSLIATELWLQSVAAAPASGC